jgi:hypothetical protein
MSFYIRTVPGHPHQAWKITDRAAHRLGVSNPEQGPGCYFRAEGHETIWDAIKRGATGWFEPDGVSPFHKTKLAPGQYYKRISRPIDQHPNDSFGWSPGADDDRDFIASAQTQLLTLLRQMEEICRTIHPCDDNMNAYGHEIRNIIILSCTEVEMHWRGILSSNGISKKLYNRNDYVKLEEAMRLSAYSVSMNHYPWLSSFLPFQAWAPNSTLTLEWYDAYNGVKHNRENEFHKASLRHAFQAICACAIMLHAEFGIHAKKGMGAELYSYFSIDAVPAWPLGEVYLYPYDEPNGWIAKSFWG